MNHDGSHLRSRIGRALAVMVVAVAALGAFASPAAAKSSGADHASAVIRNGAGEVTGWAKFTEDAMDDLGLIGREAEQIAFFGAKALDQRLGDGL